MKRRLHLIIIFSAIFSFLINCSDDEVTEPEEDGSGPTVEIITPSDNGYFAEGDTIDFSGTGLDPEGGTLPDSMFVWLSDQDDTIGTGRSVRTTLLSAAAHVITLRGTDNRGRTGTDAITIDIISVPQGFALIPHGTFMMGSPVGENERNTDEMLHAVTLTMPYCLSVVEVTNIQYAELAQYAYDRGYCTVTDSTILDALDGSIEVLAEINDSSSEIFFDSGTFGVDSEREDHPVIEISWYGAAAFCDWLSLREGLPRAYDHSDWQCHSQNPYNAVGYRLPTEAEWERACRAGTITPFNTGECLYSGTQANYDGSRPYPIGCPPGPYAGWSVAVALFSPNGYGLYDMHGNVWEWCNDRYDYYNGDETDPIGSLTGNSRVLRGGSWNSSAVNCRSAYRSWGHPSNKVMDAGFRVWRGSLRP